ncbi:F-box only protein 6-like isoform X2 [Megalops cyprinoides]|nr:F-box only protein 6-like isoform X2 [Megalops cyprinoides]
MLPVLPLAALEEVFVNVPAREVVCVCRLVCREWKELADSASLWRERCRREGLQPHDVTQQPEDWRVYYFLCKKRHNLLKNPKAEDKFNGWQILENGGDRWKIEDVSASLPDETVKKFFVTSYHFCRKSQLINLAEEGYGPWFMDKIQPDIVISDWYSPRWDCGSEYEICVELLDQRKKVIQKFSPDTVYFEQWNDQQWQQMTHVFRDYGKGVRYVRFTHGGKDTQFWAGWYGIRVTNSSVEIRPRINT